MIIRPKWSIASGESWKYFTGQKWCSRVGYNSKVNRFGWNLEHCEHIVMGWPWWQILGVIRAVATLWEAGVICFGQVNNARLCRFVVIQHITSNKKQTNNIKKLIRRFDHIVVSTPPVPSGQSIEEDTRTRLVWTLGLPRASAPCTRNFGDCSWSEYIHEDSQVNIQSQAASKVQLELVERSEPPDTTPMKPPQPSPTTYSIITPIPAMALAGTDRQVLPKVLRIVLHKRYKCKITAVYTHC